MKSNWLGNISFKNATFVQPHSIDEIQELVRKCVISGEKIRVVGAGHSWTPVCKTEGYLINLDNISGMISLDFQNSTATFKAGSRLKDINNWLWEKGYSLTNLGSIAEQSIAGATGTATHGTGIGFGNLSSTITAIKIVDGKGELRIYSEENNPDIFQAFPVSFGSLGIIVEITIRIVPKFYLKEERVPMLFEDAVNNLENLMLRADHFKLWWFPHTNLVQTYSSTRMDTRIASSKKLNLLREDSKMAHAIFWLLLKLGNFRTLVPSINRFITAIQFKAETNIGKSFEIFTMSMPPRHYEAEFAIPVEKTTECLIALRKLIIEHNYPVNFITEIRFVKADNLWLSPAYENKVCYVGGYMAGNIKTDAYLNAFEDLMLSYGGRPHWGKIFTISKQSFTKSYSRWGDFIALKQLMDPYKVFENKWIEALFQS